MDKMKIAIGTDFAADALQMELAVEQGEDGNLAVTEFYLSPMLAQSMQSSFSEFGRNQLDFRYYVSRVRTSFDENWSENQT